MASYEGLHPLVIYFAVEVIPGIGKPHIKYPGLSVFAAVVSGYTHISKINLCFFSSKGIYPYEYIS